MITLFSMIGGAGFKLIWAYIAEFLQKKQDHAQEIERLRLQAGLDKAKHDQDCERIRLQAELGVKEIVVQADADINRLEASAFLEAMKNAIPPPSGIKWVDAWNSIVRPLGATGAYLLIASELYTLHFVMTDWHRAIAGTIIGFFFASRDLAKAGK